MSKKNSSPPKAVKPCAKKAKKKKDNDKKCNYKTLTVTDDTRSYDSGKNKEQRFEIVCGDKTMTRTIKANLVSLVGPPAASENYCSHDKKTFDIDFQPDSKSNSKLVFKAKSNFDPDEADLISRWKKILWPPSAPGKEYPIRANTCGLQKNLNLIAFPNLDSSFSVKSKSEGGLEISFDKEASDKNSDVLMDILELKLAKYFEASLSSKYDGKEFLKLSLGNKSDEEKLTKLPSMQTLRYLARGLKEGRDTFKAVMAMGKGDAKISFGPQFSISCKRTEKKEDLLADYEATVSLGFDPLIKFTGSKDFMGPLLSSIPGVGPALATIKWLVEKCNAGELSLKLIFEGSVSYTGKLTKNSGKEWEGDLEPKGKAELRLEFVAAYDITISYYFGEFHKGGKFKAAGKGGIKVEPTEDKKKRYKISDSEIQIYMETKFTGVTLYWLTGSTTGNAVTIPTGIPKDLKWETTTMSDDDELSNVPKDQQWEVFPEKKLFEGYCKLM